MLRTTSFKRPFSLLTAPLSSPNEKLKSSLLALKAGL